MGAVACDHGTGVTRLARLDEGESNRLFEAALKGLIGPAEAEALEGHLLVEMARMSLEDGLVMQLHPGSFRNHNQPLYHRFGRDIGADIPVAHEFTRGLRPLLNLYGNEPKFRLIVFTLDETTYSRELAPLAGRRLHFRPRHGSP